MLIGLNGGIEFQRDGLPLFRDCVPQAPARAAAALWPPASGTYRSRNNCRRRGPPAPRQLVAERQRRQQRRQQQQEEGEQHGDGAQAAGDEPARTAERRSPGIGGWASYWASASARAEAELAAPMAHHSAPAAGAAQAAVVGTPDEALSTLERTRLVVGFHPDQATEAAVDLALALRVPFAVVPCCVFPSLFPHRRTREGKPVASYDEFVEYLRAKVAGVR